MCIISGLVAGGVISGIATAAAVVADIGLAATAIGGAVSSIQGYQQAQAAEAQAKYMAQQERDNAKQLRIQGEQIKLQGDQEKAQLRLKMLQQKGNAKAAYAASGVVLGSGSSADYMADIADAYDLDRRNLSYDIESRRWQARSAAVNAENQAAWYDAQAESYKDAKTTSLFTGMLGTTLNTAGMFLRGTTGAAWNTGGGAASSQTGSPDLSPSLLKIGMGV